MEEELKEKHKKQREVDDGELTAFELNQQIILFNLTKDELLETVAEFRKEKVYAAMAKDESDDDAPDAKQKNKNKNKKNQKQGDGAVKKGLCM